MAEELGIRGIRVDAGHPLHNVKGAEARLQAEVRSRGKLVWIGRIGGELVRRKLLEPHVLGVYLNKHTRKPRQIGGGRVRNDVQIPGGTHEAVNTDGHSSDDDEVDPGAG